MRLLHWLLPLAMCPVAAQAQAIPDQPSLPDAELAKLRGGFVLPGGLSIALGVTTETRIDSQLVTRTTYTLDRGAPRVDVAGRAAGASDLSAVALNANDAAVPTADGSLTLRSGANGTQVRFSGESIDVTSLVGRALGSVVANSANDRSIDVTTAVTINIGGVTPDRLGSSMIRAGELALDSTRMLIR